MSVGPPTGMRDWLPQETLLRQRLMEAIGSVYRLYGYLPIDTPVMEDLSVLLGKGGGENEKLLFKILKRGEKLTEAQTAGGDIADYGLRFDLTVPLARFVATHQGKLPKIFRRYHIAPVWRADRPQKGRFREFYQCDIDVVGGASPDYEVEIITATERVLKELNLGSYRFRLSDKRLLPLLLRGYGVAEQQVPALLIALDKLDKDIPHACREIEEVLPRDSGSWAKVNTFVLKFSTSRPMDTGRHERMNDFTKFLDGIDGAICAEIKRVLEGLRAIIASVLTINPDSSIVFDPVLVRGMDYYTGPVYEAVVDGFPSSILGGGRYDGLIGRFAGKPIPAVGCSIGFERILTILQDRQSGSAVTIVDRALLVNEGQHMDVFLQQAERLRSEGLSIETYLDQDEVGKQLKYAEAAGFTWAIKHFDADSLSLTVRRLSNRQDRVVSLVDFKALLHSK